jgi:hypothetical protein
MGIGTIETDRLLVIIDTGQFPELTLYTAD